MKIRTLWEITPDIDDCTPWLVGAMDEYTDDCGPSDATEHYETEKAKPYVREMVIEIPDGSAEKLFATPTVKGSVAEEVMTAEPEAKAPSVKVYGAHDFREPSTHCLRCGADWYDQGQCQVPRVSL